MKKIFILLLISVFIQIETLPQSAFVTEEQARSVAEKFYFERVQPHRNLAADQIKAAKTFIIEENLVSLYYIFNISAGGFVIVSAYDATPPVLAYSFNGEYIADNQPDNFKAWMDQYKRQISYALSTNARPSDETAKSWKYYQETPLNSIRPFSGRDVQPMLTTTWDQGTYYNAMCPEDPAGPAGHCVTGCVATALGQLVNYFRWPETGTGSYSYDCPPYGTLGVDFSNATYNWDLMENSLNRSNAEVAEIIYHLGVSVDMVYGPDGSGMYNHKAAYTLKTFFKYSPETQYVFRDSTTMDWDSLIISHLDRKIPLYYAGWSVPNIYGHAFICDGYQGENFYHFNWGWSGSNDGYFYTDNLTPGGNNFNLAQELVINAVPDTNLYSYPVHCQGDKNYEALFGTLDDGSGPLYAYNNGSDCSWLITPNDSVNGITLSFHRFGTEENDYISIYDGADTNAPVLGTFSGDELPPAVTSTSGNMFIQFKSDSDMTTDGFLASFESEIPVFCSGMMMLNEQTDTISDGSGNWNYHDNSACLWRIIPEGAGTVTLYFTEFATEPGFDILKIYDLQTQQLLAEYSGTYATGVPPPVTSLSGKMFISFNTNSITTSPGWEAYYESNLVGLKEPVIIEEMIVYPNPAKDYLNISFRNNSPAFIQLNLADLSGRIVFNSEVNRPGDDQIRIDISNLAPGVYLLSSKTGEGNTEYHRVIKN